MLPSFETERLWVRPRTMADFDACLAMDRDPEVTKFIPGPWNEPAKHEAFLKERIETSLGDGLGYWFIFPKVQPDQFAGWILLIPYDGIGPEVEIGWRLNRSAWGRGFAAEAVRPIIEHAFHTVGLKRIVADINPSNLSSLRVAEKIGMNHIGDGKPGADPCKCYAMTKADLIKIVSHRS
ncbi:GNAT family N-acetyltransferase [Pseudochrobactrum sp. Wa41.01b-1]|uniref:GNAT family N-acetyltransferase n=1 Tax=Pseudochrobactrum sp. Wa41.01b-1 TaxID=2864102 RepID=UPI001C68CE50|nr:GNAT family N-acetyltransferase [Pseudochrobactrum sp. Wa41.01b-1]QYM71695.1 GNAT family N-acetyltransferase [Pseudochrobactrum sp. Wa41.01b-1]